MTLKRAFQSLLLSIALCFASGSTLEASDYVGEFCWRFLDSNPIPGEFGYGTLGVSLAGDGHYLVSGRITDFENNVAENSSAVSGNLEIINNELVVTLTVVFTLGTSGQPGEFGYSVASLRLDPSTRNGTFRAITQGWNPGGTFFGPEYEVGTVVFDPDCTP